MIDIGLVAKEQCNHANNGAQRCFNKYGSLECKNGKVISDKNRIFN